MRSVFYRFPDLRQFERMLEGSNDAECELGVPAGEKVEDNEWVLAVFELGTGKRATSAAARAVQGGDSTRLVFEPRDWKRLQEFAQREARHAISDSLTPPPPSKGSAPAPAADSVEATESEPIPPPPETARSVVPPPLGSSPARSVRGTPQPNARVLVVDDDPDIREVVAAMLEAVGLTVIPVGSAEDALTRVQTEAFDLLVFDWNLPKMSGIDLCRAIRRDARVGMLPILFLTANASSQDMVEAFASGGDDYVVKPFRAPELGARIFSLLRRSRNRTGS